MQKYSIWDFNDKPILIDPELVFPMLDYFCEEICNIIAKYDSRHLDLEIAREICTGTNPDWGKNCVIAIIACLAIIDPQKVASKGIEISLQTHVMKNNIDKWIETNLPDKTDNDLFAFVLKYFDEPIGFAQEHCSLYFTEKKIDKKVRIWLQTEIKNELIIYKIADVINLTSKMYNALINCDYKDIPHWKTYFTFGYTATSF